MPPLVLSIGLLGNITALVVFFKANLKKIGPTLIYKLMFIWDTIYIILILVTYFQYPFSLDLTILSKLSCKIFFYSLFQGGTITPILLIYISVEKYIAISSPSKRKLLTSTKNQIIYFICVFAYCSACAIATPFYIDLFEYNQNDSNGTNSSYLSCNFVSYEGQLIVNSIDLINREFMPALLMICFSFMLVFAVFKSSARVGQTINQQNRRKRDIRLAINCLFMNFTFILLQTPITVVFFLPNAFSGEMFYLTSYLFYMSYGINFYVLLVCNSLFRDELLKLLGIKIEAANQPIRQANQTQKATGRNNNNL